MSTLTRPPVAGRSPGSSRFPAPALLLPTGTSLLLIALWELLARIGTVPTEISRPTEVLDWFQGQAGEGEFWAAVGDTVQHTLSGLLIGGAAGVVLGLGMGTVPVLHRLLHGTVEFLRAIPVIVYLPLLILVFGAVPKTAVTLVAVAVTWPMLFQTMYGVRSVDALLTETGRMFGLTRRQRLAVITLPGISPFLATGIRISLSIALVVSVSIELIAGVPGLGWSLTQYQTAGNYPAVIGIVVVTGTLGLVLNKLMLLLERRALRWHVSHRKLEG